ncbi:nSTAND1 domain-containing NTPase [Phytohabitans sp. LJ34]|uniref:nSTAND1 domain-containing NTPase n=1 Tax=Phytohabitans sp. LJ34 TaxID=3452217 RepID=UPI003F8C1B41
MGQRNHFQSGVDVPDASALDACVAAILDGQGRAVGAGFLVGQDQVLTCAHVVARSLGLPDDSGDTPGDPVRMVFPLVAAEHVVTARVEIWAPPRPDHSGDIAGLRLVERPAGIRPLGLLPAGDVWHHRCRVFGFPARRDGGVWFSGRLLGRLGSGWIQVEADGAVGFRIAPGFSGAPVWDEQLGGIVGMAVAAETNPALRTAYLIPSEQIFQAWPEVVAASRPPCPYRGLAPFREADAELFFGRDALADRLAQRVTGSRFIAVVGASGSGKSSLVYAGLLPRVRPRGFAVATFRPVAGLPVATMLADALLPLLEPDASGARALEARATLSAAIGDGRLAELLGDVLARTGAGRLLVVVDQFEELVVADRRAARELAEVLVAISQGAVAVHVTVTLRPHLLDIAADHLALDEAARETVYLVGPMRPDDLRTAIEAPLRDTGVVFEPGLVERIVADVDDAPAALTLVEFTLTQLWETQDAGRLTHAAYEELGGVTGALTSYAEQVWTEQLGAAQRTAARRLFVQLVRPDPHGGTRRTARAAELDAELLPVAEVLAAGRLLVAGHDPGGGRSYDLAHEVLAVHWDRMRAWLAEERDFRSWQEDLRASMDRAEPLRRQRLADGVRWLRAHPSDISADERDFILASRRRHRRVAVAWRGAAALIVALLVLTSTFAVVLDRRSDELDAQVRENAAQLLGHLAGQQDRSRPDTAVLTAIAAYRTSPHPQALVRLFDQYDRYRATSRLLDIGAGDLTAFAASSDGSVIAAAGRDGVLLWGRVDQRLERVETRTEFEEGIDARIGTLAVSPDGATVAAAFDGGRIAVIGPSRKVVTLHDGATTPDLLRFDGQGHRLIAGFPGEGLRIFDVTRATAERTPAGLPDRANAWFGPGRQLVVATRRAGNTTLDVWDLATGRRRTLTAGATAAGVSGDARTAVACVDQTLHIWDLVTGARRPPVTTRGGCDDGIAAPGNLLGGEILVDHSARAVVHDTFRRSDDELPGRSAEMTDLETGATAHVRLPAGEAGMRPEMLLGTTSRGWWLATALGPTVAVADVEPSAFSSLDDALATPGRDLVLDADRRRIATLTPEGPWLRLWDATTGQELGRADRPPDLPRVPENPSDLFAQTERLYGFVDSGRTILMVDAPWRHLLVWDTATMRLTARIPIPAAPGVPRPSPGTLWTSIAICEPEAATTDTITVWYGGMLSRFDIRRGTQVGDAVQPWRTRTELLATGHGVACASWPGRPEVAVQVDQRRVEMWSATEGTRIAELPMPEAAEVRDMRYTPDGQRLMILTDGSLQMWDVARRRLDGPALTVSPPGTIPELVGIVRAGHLTGTLIGIKSSDGFTLWSWDRRAAVLHLADAGDVDLADDGNALQVTGNVGRAVYPLAPEQWAAHLCAIVGRDLTADERATLPAGTSKGTICGKD